MGLPDYLGWEWKSAADIPIIGVPGCPAAAVAGVCLLVQMWPDFTRYMRMRSM